VVILLVRELNTSIQQGHNELIKSDGKDIYNLTKICIFQINAVLLNFLVIKESCKMYCVLLHKNIKQHNCFQHSL